MISFMPLVYMSHMEILNSLFEPRNNKTNKLTVRPAKTQVSLGIRPILSESSLCAYWVANDSSFLHADSEDSVDNKIFVTALP